jgi:hypothetical protein
MILLKIHANKKIGKFCTIYHDHRIAESQNPGEWTNINFFISCTFVCKLMAMTDELFSEKPKAVFLVDNINRTNLNVNLN